MASSDPVESTEQSHSEQSNPGFQSNPQPPIQPPPQPQSNAEHSSEIQPQPRDQAPSPPGLTTHEFHQQQEPQQQLQAQPQHHQHQENTQQQQQQLEPQFQQLLSQNQHEDQQKEHPQPQPQELEASNQQQSNSKRPVMTQTVKLSDELNIFDWFRTTDIIGQIAERARNSVDSVITTLDPGMKEYLFSGGDINIMVLTDSQAHIAPVRDAFLYVFGRATVTQAHSSTEHPIKLANGFNESLAIAKARIKSLRLDTSKIPRNQVVAVVQPTLISIRNLSEYNGGDIESKDDLNQWFFTYGMLLEDPVQNLDYKSFSQLIPIDSDTVMALQEAKVSHDSLSICQGFSESIDKIMNNELKLIPQEIDEPCRWIRIWSGLDEIRTMQDLGITLALNYKRKWNNNFISNK